jgi:hypothetical protein
MLITNFRLKYILYRIVLSGYQLFDTGRLHPVRERAIRALNASVDYVEQNMPDALGFDTQKDVLTYAIAETKIPGYYLEFGVFTGGTIRYLARLRRDQTFHGFDSFEGLPEAWGGFNLGAAAFSRRGCDIYSSTVDILSALADRFAVGTVIVFDEYFNYTNWERHEFKAWHEFVEAHGVEYEYLAYARQQVALRITGLRS